MPYSLTHTGIVLKNFPGKYKIALLDESAGRIDAVHFGQEFSPGTAIQYHISFNHNGRGNPKIDDVHLYAMPFFLARSDVLFLHHVLEICFHFVPVGSCTDGIFDALRLLYATDSLEWNMLYKKIFLFKLFVTIGYYPDVEKIGKRFVGILLESSLRDIPSDIEVPDLERHLTDWLRQCIAQHPAIEYFNTVQFVTRS